MRNYIIGILTGIAAGCMYFADPAPPFYLWLFFIVGSGLVAFGFDVLWGSIEEHQLRAAWMGFTLFGGLGAFLLFIVLKAGF